MTKALTLLAVSVDGKLSTNAPLMLHTRLEELFSFADCVLDEARVDELHNMRIAAKRLRYTLEIFGSCFGDEPFNRIYDTVKKIQEQIGEIHDADVRVPLLEVFLAHNKVSRPEIEIGLNFLIAQQKADRTKRFASFAAYWHKISKLNFKRQFVTMLSESGNVNSAKRSE